MNRLETRRGTFVATERRSLAPWLTTPLPPTLCFSDTHLLPRQTAWSDDAPEDLVALIEALPKHELLSLGDLTESIGLSRADRDGLATSPRLEPLFTLLTGRPSRIVIGNHDEAAVEILEQRLGSHRVARGFDVDRLCIRHGHEGAVVRTAFERRVGPWAVPLYERVRRARANVDPRRARDDAILARLAGASSFLLFGHTHSPFLGAHAANPGCFLRSTQSFLTVEGDELALWRRA